MESETYCDVCGARLEDFDKKYIIDNFGDSMVICYDCKVIDDVGFAFDGLDPDEWEEQ